MTPPRAAVVGIAGPALLSDEAALFRAFPPAGVILFGRNVQHPRQLAALIASLPEGADVMVDQEGGRVARLRPPHWHGHPPAATFGRLFASCPAAALRAAWLTGALIGLDCGSAGFTIAATPVLDICGARNPRRDRRPRPRRHPVAVAGLGRAVANGVLAAGLIPVGKHAPGMAGPGGQPSFAAKGCATGPDCRYPAFRVECRPAMDDDRPYRLCGARSRICRRRCRPTVIEGVIRGRIGFEGVLVTDDLAMKALSGAPADLAVQALAAGCDVALYCSGDFALTEALLRACPVLTPAASHRLQAGGPRRRSGG